MAFDIHIGIRGRLFVAFGVVVAMTAAASVVGWVLFSQLGDEFEAVVSKNIPAVTLASRFAEIGATIIGTAPTLATVSDEGERRRIWALLASNLQRINELYRESDGDPVAGMKAQTSALVSALTANLRELDENVRRALWYQAQKEGFAERLRWTLADFLDEMEPMLDDIYFNIERITAPGRDGLAMVPGGKGLDIELGRERALFRINSGGSLLAGLIGGAAYLPDQDALGGSELYVREIESRLQDDLEVIRNIPGALAIEQSLQDILDFADGSRSLFQMRKEELLAIQDRELLLQKNLSLVSDLQELIAESVRRENRAALAAVAVSRDAINRGKIVLLIVTIGSLLTAILVVWFYMGRNMVKRISALDTSMRKIAQGDLKTEIRVTGGDEIGAMAGSLKTFRDTLLQTQYDLVQTGKLALLGQLSAGIAHEINQPLSAIRHFARNATIFLDQGRVEEARLNMDKIAQLIERARRITERIRSMARKPGQELGRVDLLATVHNVLTLLEHRIQKMGVTVVLQIEEGSCFVEAGQVRLEQVLLNLLNNGFDAMVSSETRRLEISSRDVDGRVELTVHDSGPGIAETDIDRVFDPFFSTKEVGKGVGIGLSISYNIVKDFGGIIRCESSPEEGTSFRITLNRSEKRS